MAVRRTTFDEVAKDLIQDAERRTRDGECSPTLVRDYRQRLNGYCLPFFKSARIADIDAARLRKFRGWLSDRGLKASTSQTVMSFVSMVLKHAEADGIIRQLPRVPRGGHFDSPRPAFKREEWKGLLSTCKRIEKGNPSVAFKGTPVDKELRLLLTFMNNTFFRPGDVFALKHKHVQIVKPLEGSHYLRLSPPPSKRHSNDIISMPAAVPIYDNVRAFNLTKGHAAGPEDYVFLPDRLNRAYAKEIVRRQFSEVLKVAGLSTNTKGEKHTLYSMRHTAIVTRLLMSENLDLLTLARNCRTSVEMIDRFYASSLTAEMNLHKLHSFRGETRYAA